MKQLNIDCVNLELTTNCNLSCPFCSRAIYKEYDMIYPKGDFKREFWPKLGLENMRAIVLCGTFGDVIFYPHLFDFLRYSFDQNSHIEISIHTNGSAHNTAWWEELASILKNRHHLIMFAVDGMEDTHKIHRVGSDFNTVIRNMKTAKAGGCNVVWQFIMFKHNEHQISEARRLSKEIGCRNFVIRKSFFYTDEFQKPSFFPYIMSKVEHEKNEVGTIHCRIDVYNEVAILSNGDVTPCCHVTPHNYKKLGIEPLNLAGHTLKEILENGYIQDILNEVETKEFCKRCLAISKNSHTIESLLMENLHMKRIMKEREQKKELSNKV